MVIVDSHVHGYPPKDVLGNKFESLVNDFTRLYYNFYKNMGWWKTASFDWSVETYIDRGLVDNMIAEMDRCGVDKVVIASMAPYPIEWKMEMMKRYPDRIYAYSGVDPMGGKASVEELERDVKKFGTVGVKLGPPYQNFYPNDERVYPIYEKALDLGVPVAFHTGWAPYFRKDVRLKYALPIYLDDVAVDFPKLKIIWCHMGAGWFSDFALVAAKNPNIYADFAGCIEYTPIIEFITVLERLVSVIGADRVMLASDYPLFRMETFIEITKSLRITDEEKRKILGENAMRILKLK